MNRAFSLVELSIVLVILGLLTGGILAGQSLIRAAELRAVSTDVARYKASLHTFRDKYLAIPGDMPNATRFWTRQVNATHCPTNSAAAVSTPGACDGNGDGMLQFAGAPSESGENYQSWRHLALAGLIEGSYTGTAGAASLGDTLAGTNAPAMRVSNVACYLQYWDNTAGGGASPWYAVNYRNALTCGTKATWHDQAFLRPEEAWNIDTKMDDGMPGRGRVMSSVVANCTTSTNGIDFAGQYALTSTAQLCALRFLDMI